MPIKTPSPVIRRRLQEVNRSASGEAVSRGRSPSESPHLHVTRPSELASATMSAKARKMLAQEMARGSPRSVIHAPPKDGPTVVYSANVKVAEAKLASGSEVDGFAVVDLDAGQFRTRTVAKSSNPLWSEESTMRFTDPSSSVLRVSLWDEHGKSERILGKVDVDLSAVTPNVPSIMEWYSLSYASNAAYVSGDLHVRLDMTQKETTNSITVNVIEGRNLALRTRSSTETFVRATMGKQSVKSKTHKTQDKHTNRSNNAFFAEAEWNEPMELKLDDGIGDITISVYKTTGLGSTNVCIGQLILSPFELPPLYEGWVRLDVSPEMLDKEVVKAGAKEAIGDLRLTIQVTRAVVYPIEYYDPLISLLMDEGSVANLVSVFELTTIKPEDRVTVALRLVNVYEAKNKAPAILKALVSREILLAPDVETLFRANSLASKALDMYMKIAGHRYLQYCVQDTIDAIYKDGGKKNYELDPSKLDKTDDAKKNWKALSKMLDSLLERIFNSAEHCPPGMVSIFTHLQKEVEAKFADTNVRYTGVSSFLFLRLIVPAILGPKLFDIVPDHPPPKVAANLTALGRIVQRIANMSPMDISAKDVLREREFYMEKQKRPMQVFIDSLCQRPTSLDFDPAAVDLQQELACLQAHLEGNIEAIIGALKSSENAGTVQATTRLLVSLDAMAGKSVRPRKPTLVRSSTNSNDNDDSKPQWKLNPLFDPEADKFHLDAISSESESSPDSPASSLTLSTSGSGTLRDASPAGKTEKRRSGKRPTERDTLKNSAAATASEPKAPEPRKSSKLDRML